MANQRSAISGIADYSKTRVMLFNGVGVAPSDVPASAFIQDLSGLQPLDATLTALAALDSSAGILQQTGADTFAKLPYAVGTWTPTLIPASGSFGAITYDAITAGEYTRIGNILIATGSLRTDAITIGTASGAMSIGGLPVTSAAPSVMTVGYSADWSTNNPTGGLLQQSATTIQILYRATANGNSASLTHTSLGTGANANDIRFSIMYRV